MSVGNRDAFEQRLARIRESHESGAAHGIGGAAKSRRPLRSAVLAVVVLALGGAAFVGLQGRAHLLPLPESLARIASPQPSAPPTEAAATEAAATGGMLDWLNSLFGGGADAAQPPPTLTGLLPAAPQGWVRLTAAEAADPQAMDRLRAAWDALPPEGRPALDGHPGLAQVRQFIADAAGQTTQTGATRTRALYLGTDLGVLTLTAILRPAREAFGPAGDDMAWNQALRRALKDEAQSGDIIEAVTLGNVAAFNRTRAQGKSTVSRPIGRDHDTATAMRLSAALSHRLEVRITGTATPAAAGLLLAGFDKAGAARLSE